LQLEAAVISAERSGHGGRKATFDDEVADAGRDVGEREVLLHATDTGFVGFDDAVAALGPKDCCIKTSLQTLPELKETSQLTRLIQQKALFLEGELNVAQQVSALFQQLDIDVEELLAQKTNDVVAHQTVKTAKAVHEKALSALSSVASVLGNAVVEEKQLAAHKLAVMHFSDEVNALRDRTESADARLRRLEEKLK